MARYAPLPADGMPDDGDDAWPTLEEIQTARQAAAARKQEDEAQRKATALTKQAALATICARIDPQLRALVHDSSAWHTVDSRDLLIRFLVWLCGPRKMYAYLTPSDETCTVDGVLYDYADVATALNAHYRGTACPYAFRRTCSYDSNDEEVAHIEVTYR